MRLANSVLLIAVNNDGSQCKFPAFVRGHHDWHSVASEGQSLTLDLHKRGHTMKLRDNSIRAFFGGGGPRNQRQEVSIDGAEGQVTQATCHKVETTAKRQTRIVAHVKAGW